MIRSLLFSLLLTNPTDTTKVLSVFPDPEAKYPATILYAGFFHGEEVPPKSKSMKWLGIYFEEKNFSLLKATPRFTKEHDAIVDDNETIKTGVKVSIQKNKNVLLLFSGIKLKENKKIDPVDISGHESILPGKEFKFTFNKIDFTIFATGKGDNADNIENYRIYYKTGEKTQLICAQPYLDANMPSLVFIGDIDNDKIPDLILNNTHHYNVGRLTLYLSSFAQDDEIVKVVGMLTKTGC